MTLLVLHFLDNSLYTVHAMQSKFPKTHICTCSAEIMRQMFLDYAINNKLTPFVSMQNHYSLVYREEEREMMPTLKVSLIGFTSLAVLKEYAALRSRMYPLVSASSWFTNAAFDGTNQERGNGWVSRDLSINLL